MLCPASTDPYVVRLEFDPLTGLELVLIATVLTKFSLKPEYSSSLALPITAHIATHV